MNEMKENKLSERKDFIHKAPVGQYLGLSGCEALAACISGERQLKDNEYLYHGGALPNAFFMVASGRLALCREDSSIHRNRIIHIYEKGDLVGELSLIIEEKYHFSVQSIDTSSVYIFDQKEFNRFYQDNPTFMFDFLKAVIKRILNVVASVSQQKDELATYLVTGGKKKL